MNTHYYRTEVDYDHRGRKNRTKDGLGDIARTVYDGCAARRNFLT